MRIAHVIETQQLRDARPLITALALAAMIAISPACAQWQPSRNVEIIVPAAAGSSLDSMARLFQRVIQDKRLTKSSQTVVNKAGGGNAVGFNYLASHAADGHYVLVTPFTVITNRIMGSNPLSYQDFTPLAMLADEHIAFVVSANSPLKTGRDLLERLKKDPGAVSMALASALGNANHIAVCLVGKAVGADSKRFKIAVFNSSGESITAVLGVTSTSQSPQSASWARTCRRDGSACWALQRANVSAGRLRSADVARAGRTWSSAVGAR